MPRYHGKGGMVYISTTAAGALSMAVSLSKWSLDMKTDKVEVTAFGDNNRRYVAGLKDVAGAISGFWDDTGDTLWQAADSGDGVKMVLYPSRLAPTKYWTGPAWLDASIDVDSGGANTVSGSFVANGDWSRF